MPIPTIKRNECPEIQHPENLSIQGMNLGFVQHWLTSSGVHLEVCLVQHETTPLPYCFPRSFCTESACPHGAVLLLCLHLVGLSRFTSLRNYPMGDLGGISSISDPSVTSFLPFFSTCIRLPTCSLETQGIAVPALSAGINRLQTFTDSHLGTNQKMFNNKTVYKF